MADGDGFWKLEHLSDARLLESLGGVLRAQRRALAALVAHLGEVEDRRLHLEAACSSMFVYCVERLGMSEDEACRRIELARLARRFPALFAELASGQITLSVALMLKSVLTPSNHLGLLAAARGLCIRQARELVAKHFPRPDVPSSIRKLPDARRVTAATAAFATTPAPEPSPTPERPLELSDLPGPSRVPGMTMSSMTAPASAHLPSLVLERQASSSPGNGSARSVSSGLIEPLSEGRYRIQFTADIELKQKLERTRNLLRHAHPSGDFAPIVSRALDLLIDDLLRRRFGAQTRRKGPSPPASAPAGSGPAQCAAAPAPAKAAPTPRSEIGAQGSALASASAMSTVTGRTAQRRRHVRCAARRAVLERDGLGCTWVDANGVRCGSQAWLELDHREPAGKGGSSEPDNLRLLCRAHNLLAAERAYGRQHIARESKRRKKRSRPTRPPDGNTATSASTTAR